jgi:hypothetical protein
MSEGTRIPLAQAAALAQELIGRLEPVCRRLCVACQDGRETA